MNALSDMDWGWWPFLVLRPPRHEPISVGRLGVMSLAFGVAYGLLGFGIMAKLGRIPWGLLPACVALAVGGFFVGWGVMFRPFWNRRAHRLRR